jgi:hypothetical protein
MKKQTRSILDEISNIIPKDDIHSVVESRATQVIASVTNLINLIESSYPEPQRSELLKRLFNSIKTGDERKFQRGIKAIKESKNENKRHQI